MGDNAKEKTIVFSHHVLDRAGRRGTNKAEIKHAIKHGERVPAKKGRLAYRKNFPFQNKWKGKYYETKQVMPIVAERNRQVVVVTVYVFYIGGGK